MRIWITGIAGFIGFHTALRLRERGHEVVGCDNFNPYYDPALKRARAHLLAEAKVMVHELDLCDEEPLRSLLLEAAPDALIHLAAQAGVRYAAEQPLSYVKNNVEAWVRLLEIARHLSGMRLLYASSSSVYGNNEQIPFAESDAVNQPANLYAATKRSGELIAYAYHHLYQIPLVGLRFFTAYGPWGRPDMAYYKFTQAICQGDPITIYGTGSMRRDFTYIDDIVDGIEKALHHPATWDCFNLGHSEPHSVLDLVRTLEELLDRKATIQWAPPLAGEVPTTYADLRHSEATLGYQPRIPLREGLARFTQWYTDRIQWRHLFADCNTPGKASIRSDAINERDPF